MDRPDVVMAECPTCSESPHTILKGRTGSSGRTLDAVARCNGCGLVHHITLMAERETTVRLVISEGRVSRRTSVDLPVEDVISVGDEFFAGHDYVQVRSIEAGGRRVRRARAGDIETIWARHFDRVRVRLSVHRGARSVSTAVTATPDEEFSVGDVLEVDGHRVAVHRIKCDDGRTPKVAQARHIVRLYGKEIR